MSSEQHPELIEGDQPKKKRKRLKHICAQIRDQMEFYFSDANLRKDRFLKQLVDQDASGYVLLETFSKFNKLRSITTDMQLVAKALSTSQLLQLNEDKTHVRRTTPLSDVDDTDERTVYVENLPSTADHDWVRSLFSVYGKVLYVSIPRYKATRDIKGFAFVEFDTVHAARSACQLSDDAPEEVLGKFPKMSKSMRELRKQAARVADPEEIDAALSISLKDSDSCINDATEGSESGEPPAKMARSDVGESATAVDADSSLAATGDDETKNGKSAGASADSKTETDSVPQDSSDSKTKRKHSESESSDESEEDNDGDESADDADGKPPAVKRQKHSDEDAEDTSAADQKKTGESLKRGCGDSESGAREAKRVRISDCIQVKDVPRKKKKRKRKEVEKLKERNKDDFGLRVISKGEWLKLRNEYLSLQKTSMKQLKQILQNRHKDKKPEKKEIELIPNVIIKVTSSVPSKRQNIKELCGRAGEIAYIQWIDDDMSGYIRCPDASNAARIAAATQTGLTFALLQGDEEKRYWEKLNADREAKHSKSSRKKTRGTQKIIDKAEKCMGSAAPTKHMFFDE